MFEVKGNPQLDKDSFTFSKDSKYPYFTRTVFNNGILGYVDYLDDEHLVKGNSLAVGMMGMRFFYMKHDFYAGQFTKTAFPLFDGFNESVALWFISWLNKSSTKYLGLLVRDFENAFNNTELIVPYKDGQVAVDYIESRIRELEESRIRELEAYLLAAGFEDCVLTQSERNALRCIAAGQKEMRIFRVIDEFTVANSHNILKSDVVFGSGSTPYVTASEGNNSIVSYISYKHDMIEKGNSIMIGGKTLVITYQPDDFFSNDSHNLVLTINHELGRTESAQLFMVAALYKSLSPKYSWGDSISKAKIQNDEVFLPVKADGTIDFAFMNTYISAIKKQCIAALKQEISREHQAYEQATGLSPIENETKEENKIIVLPDFHEGCVPLYTLRAACGYFEDGDVPEEEGWVDATGNGFTPDPKRHFAVHAKGNSMLPKIKDGDLCVFEWYRAGSRNGEIVLTQSSEFDSEYGGKYTIKKYHSEKVVTEEGWQHSKVELIPLNKDFDVIELDEETEYRTIGILKCVLSNE